MVKDLSILTLSYQLSVGLQLADVIRAAGVESVTVTSSVRETLMALSQRSYDLVIVPAEDPSQRVRALKSIRPELNVALLLSTDKQVIPADLENGVLGVLHPAHLKSQIPLLLARLSLADLTDAEPALSDALLQKKKPASVLQAALNEIEARDELLQVVLSKDAELLACEGQLPITLAQRISGQTSKSWDKNSQSVQIQFLETGDEPDPLLLYTRPAGSLLLTLVAKPHVQISVMRRQADKIAAWLAKSNGSW